MGSRRMSANRIRVLVEKITQDILVNANIVPATNNEHNLGDGEGGEIPLINKGWANVFTNDLHLQNERGHYRIVEEADDLTIQNVKTGKWYKFVLQEIETDGGDE